MYTEVSLQYPLETCKCVGRLGIYIYILLTIMNLQNL